jgi:hypothetical protein
MDCNVCGTPGVTVRRVADDPNARKQTMTTHVIMTCKECGKFALEEPTPSQMEAANLTAIRELARDIRRWKQRRLENNEYLHSYGIPYERFPEAKTGIDAETFIEFALNAYLAGMVAPDEIPSWSATVEGAVEVLTLCAQAQETAVMILAGTAGTAGTAAGTEAGEA